MTVISGVGFKKLIEKGELKVEPFYEENLQPASYDCRLGGVLQAGIGRINLDSRQEFILESNTWACISSMEVLELPNNVAASYGILSSLARRGLIAFGGPQIDPGYRGKIFVSVYNPTLEPIALKQGQDFFTLILHLLDEKLDSGYCGSYQDQTDFPVADVEMMMRMKSKNLSDVIDRVETLDDSVTHLAENMKVLNDNVSDITKDVHALKRTLSAWSPWVKIIFAVLGIAAAAVIGNFAWDIIQSVKSAQTPNSSVSTQP